MKYSKILKSTGAAGLAVAALLGGQTAAFAADAADTATDEAQLIQATGHPVTVVSGSAMNLKITTRDDLRLAEQVLKVLPKPRLGGPSHPFADDDRWR